MERNATVAGTVTESINLAGYSRSKMAELSGVPYATLTRKLSGHSEFTIRELGSIAKVLNLPLRALIPTEILDAA